MSKIVACLFLAIVMYIISVRLEPAKTEIQKSTTVVQTSHVTKEI